MTNQEKYTKSSWTAMMQRCYNKNNTGYHLYGGRGILVCGLWHDFNSFYKDMGDRPQGMSIDRINPNLGYFKGNCRWATKKQQSNNKRNTIKVMIGHEEKSLWEACVASGLTYVPDYIKYRVSQGDTFAKAIERNSIRQYDSKLSQTIVNMYLAGFSIEYIKKNQRVGVKKIKKTLMDRQIKLRTISEAVIKKLECEKAGLLR